MKLKKGILVLLMFCNVEAKNRGLTNCGNSCFFNSTMQALSHLNEFNEWVNSDITNNNPNIIFYKELITKLKKPGESIGQDEIITDIFTLNNFYSNINPKKKQQDAHEFIVNFINCIIIYNVEQSLQQTLHDLINIETNTVLQRTSHDQHSGYFSYKKEDNIILSLPIPNRTESSLIDCLNEYFKREVLDEGNYLQCYLCEKNVPSFKQIKISKFPKYLIISLKRFDNERKKINTPVKFQRDLKFDKKFQGLDAVLKNVMPETVNYELKALIVHSGNLDGGHYWAFGKDENTMWIRYEDSQVKEIGNDASFDESDLIKTGLDGKGTPYLLFFELSLESSNEVEKIKENLNNAKISKQNFEKELDTFKNELSVSKLTPGEYDDKINTIKQTIENWAGNHLRYFFTDFDRLYYDEFLPMKTKLQPQPKPEPQVVQTQDQLVQKLNWLQTSITKIKESVESIREKLSVLKNKLAA